MIPTEPSPNRITVTGWFTTIWNGEPHYWITDAQGQTFQLLLDPEVARPLGGSSELDRKQVTVLGEVISESPPVLRVVSIRVMHIK